MKEIGFDKQKLDRLILAYDCAVYMRLESFWFEGQEYLTSYAKYLIEYLKCKIK